MKSKNNNHSRHSSNKPIINQSFNQYLIHYEKISADSYLHAYGFLSSDSDCCGEITPIRCKLDPTVNMNHVVPFLRDNIGLSSVDNLYAVDRLFVIGQIPSYYKFPKVGIMLDWSCSHAILVSGIEIWDDYDQVERCIWYNDPSNGSFTYQDMPSNIPVTGRNWK